MISSPNIIDVIKYNNETDNWLGLFADNLI